MPAGSDTAEARLITAFQRATRDLPWYRVLLAEAAVEPGEIVDLLSFIDRVPLLTKSNTFGRFSIAELASTTPVADLAGVLTSSGHGGHFGFGLITRADAERETDFIDDGLDAAFGVRSRRTLVVNCLPMGVVFRSAAATVATTSVREDMAVALVGAFAPQYEQVVIVADPLFMKRLMDYGAAHAFDWGRARTHVILGDETFGEHFRRYVASSVGRGGDILSSYGVGELGLHLAHETPATVALRRAAWSNPELAADLLGVGDTSVSLPAILAFNADRIFVEVCEQDSSGYGQLALSMLNPGAPIALLRYVTGDLARLLDLNTIKVACERHGAPVPDGLPEQMIALRGRSRERLENGADIALYKDALYADSRTARHLSGAFRLAAVGASVTWHVQRSAFVPSDRLTDDEISSRILHPLPVPLRPAGVTIWEYERFPFGMSLDYQRKFAYA